MSLKPEKITFDAIRRTAAPFASRPPIGEVSPSGSPMSMKSEKVTFAGIRRTAAPFVFQPPTSEFSS